MSKAPTNTDMIEGTGMTGDGPDQGLPRASVDPGSSSVLVGFSGGRDSVALLHSLVTLRNELREQPPEEFGGEIVPNKHEPLRLKAVYIHHGLSPNADAWADFCRKTARRWHVPFEMIRVKVDPTSVGVEAAARDARYAALLKAAMKGGFEAVATAHHADDRIETFLLQFMRGAGPVGLSSMRQRVMMTLPDGSPSGVEIIRPLLDMPRSKIDEYVEREELDFVEDESNTDTAYERNFLRHEVVPLLAERREGFRRAAVRSVGLIEEGVDILERFAGRDLDRLIAAASVPLPVLSAVELSGFLALDEDFRPYVFRRWLSRLGLGLPTKARTDDFLRQVADGSTESAVESVFEGVSILRTRDNLLAFPENVFSGWREQKVLLRPGREFEVGPWTISLAALPGEEAAVEEPVKKTRKTSKKAKKADQGETAPVFRLALRARMQAAIRHRRPGDRMKTAPNRPDKNLKDLYAECGVPSKLRAELPVLTVDDRILWAAGIGWNHELIAELDRKGRLKADAPAVSITFGLAPTPAKGAEKARSKKN